MTNNGPTTEKERFAILDILRGMALLGIALANFPEFGLWTFLSAQEQTAMPTGDIDRVVRFLEYVFVEGKFYSIFSLLFGVGFSLFLFRHGTLRFLRRMLILALIGLVHLLFIWNGDILLLYAVGGMLLTLFIKIKDKVLLCVAVLLMILPIFLNMITQFCGIDFAKPFYDAWWAEASAQGINEDNFASWLRDAQTYPEMYSFLRQGAIERMWELVSGHRLPKVLGLFILGFLIGKHRLYARLDTLPLKRLLLWASVIALPTSLVYAWSATHSQPWGLVIHSLFYTVSIVALTFAYVCGICFLYQKSQRAGGNRALMLLAAPGRLALTNYIGHSLIGIILFYGVGFALGTSFGFIHIELTAFAVFLLQILLSHLWLSRFLFGPLEWIWRMLTYGKYFPITRKLSAK